MRFQILALSGGGYLGLFSAYILAQLEKQAGRPLASCFDLITGTSIGGILALGLGKQVPAERMLTEFSVAGPSIFSHRRRPKSDIGAILDLLRFVRSPKYSGKALRRTCMEILGEHTLLGESQHRLLIPIVNMTKGSVQMLKTAHHPHNVRDPRRRMVDIAMATSAAPTFFPLAELEDSLCADGGLVANAPDLCGLHEATHFLNQREDDVHIVSIGTTTAGFSISHEIGTKLGAYHWLRGARLQSTMISAQQQLISYILEHRLGARYLRIDAIQSPEQQAELGLDIATSAATRTIRGLADGVYQAISVDPRIATALDHRPVAPVFYS